MGLHEPHLVLDRVETAHADQHRQLVARKRRADEIAADRLAVLVRDVDDLAGRIEMREEAMARRFHLFEGRQPPRIAWFEKELSLAEVIGTAMNCFLRAADY